MSIISILVIDDQEETLDLIREGLQAKGREILTFSDPLQALRETEDRHLDIVLTDLRMPNISGLEVLTEVKSRSPETEVIVLTGHGGVESAVEAMKKGATDFFTKPLRMVEFTKGVEKLIELQTMRGRLRELSGDCVAPVGTGEAMRQVLSLARVVAETDSTVILLGETGSGKEVVADYIQRHSNRSGPYVKVNCAALPESLLESELFGHEKGSFTGASEKRIGRFERAHNGTLFLDEIAELPLSVQVKLLRVLQNKEVERIGGSTAIRVDFRLICATHRNLEELVAEGKFREDLFYRINVFPICIPPLRERMDDIPALCYHFLNRARNKIGRGPTEIHPDTFSFLQGLDWRGNVRELENVIERACVIATGSVLTTAQIQNLAGNRISGRFQARELPRTEAFAGPTPLRKSNPGTPLESAEKSALAGLAEEAQDEGAVPWDLNAENPLEEAEKITLQLVLQRCQWNYRQAAELLKMSRSTLYAKASRYGIQRVP